MSYKECQANKELDLGVAVPTLNLIEVRVCSYVQIFHCQIWQIPAYNDNINQKRALEWSVL